MVPEAGIGHWERSPVCLGSLARPRRQLPLPSPSHQLGPSWLLEARAQPPPASAAPRPPAQPSRAPTPSPATPDPQNRETPFVLLTAAFPEQPPARMKRAGVCRGALQDKECQFRHVGFNRWRHPSHALQHPCDTNPWQGRAALGAFTGCLEGWKGSFSFLFSHSKV